MLRVEVELSAHMSKEDEEMSNKVMLSAWNILLGVSGYSRGVFKAAGVDRDI